MIKTILTTFGAKALTVLLVTSTLVTTGVAVTKVAESFSSAEIPKEGMSISSPTSGPIMEESVESSDEIEPPPKVTKVIPTKAPVKITKLFPTAVLIPTTTNVIASDANNLCIITLFSQKFDVTKLESTHSGGNVFICGTDMTALYTSRHGTDLSRMNSYKYNGSTTVTTQAVAPSGPPSSVPTRTSRYNNEREDEEHEDRYVENEEEDD